jgi:cell division protein ZapD
METETIVYEQPLNEYIRFCLRLEYLFAQVKYYLDKQSHWDIHSTLATIIEIVNTIDRPDIKSKLTNALHLHLSALSELQASPGVNKGKLQNILHQLNQSIAVLHNTQGKLGQCLRDNEFLASIRQRMNIPGGTSNFAIPAYYLWLQQPLEQQQKTLRIWFSTFQQLQTIINLLLQLTRESAVPILQIAHQGFYQEMLATNISYQMIRVIIPKRNNIYPEISVGRHRLSIYFFNLDIANRATQVNDNVEFELARCKV